MADVTLADDDDGDATDASGADEPDPVDDDGVGVDDVDANGGAAVRANVYVRNCDAVLVMAFVPVDV